MLDTAITSKSGKPRGFTKYVTTWRWYNMESQIDLQRVEELYWEAVNASIEETIDVSYV